MTPKLFGAGAVLVLFAFSATALHAQDAGPQAPPPKYEVKRIPSVPHPGPPPIPEQEIIQKFAANEDEVKKAFDTYTFTQTIRMEEISDPGGTFLVSGQIYSRPDGQRSMRIVGQPDSTLKVTHFSLEDVRQIASVPLFPLTSDELANYNFKYAGEQNLDQLNTYVFQVKPKLLNRKKRFFEGVIWVDDHDLAIVKTYGKFVSEYGGNGLSLPFTMFETYRENFDGKYWFPTYTRSDDYYKLTDNQNQPVVPARGKQRNGQPVQEQDNTTLEDQPKQQPATQPDEEVQLRLIVRCTGFKVQTSADVPAGAIPDAAAPNPPAQSVKP
ncbi:MAG: hypothetical protein WB985_09475 [Candidatus Acidiferrales bacterium]